jgi:Flp pilus assembly protein TadG
VTKGLLKNQKGTEIVEFAIVSILLFLLLFGIIDFGILLYDKAVITNASREGARRGIVQNTPRIQVSEINTVVQNYYQNYLISFGSTTPTISVPAICGAFGDDLTVTVTYPYNYLALPNIVTAAGGSLGNITLVSTTVMKCE